MSLKINSVDHNLPRQGLGPILYKLDSTGRLRTWRMELDMDGGMYRTLSGLADGKQAVSGWTAVQARSQNTDAEQARFEVLAQYDHQLNREYHDNPDTVAQPKMIEPMLAKTYTSVPVGSFFQPKLDGIRCIMTVDGMFTRQGQPITAVPHLHNAARPLFDECPDLVLDGELYNHDLREDFGAISSIVRKKTVSAEQLQLAENVMQYHIYDIVDPSQPFSVRTKRLSDLLNEANLAISWLVKVATLRLDYPADADIFYGEACAAGYEGGMYRLDAPYELGRRSKSLLKRKEFLTKEFRVLAVEPGVGNWAGAAKRLTLANDDGTPFGSGIRGSFKEMAKLLADWEANPQWWDTATATCRYFMLSPDGVPRFPVVIDFQPEGRQD